MAEQNLTASETVTGEVVNPLLDPRYQALIDFKALNGLMTDEDGNMKKSSMETLARMVNVARVTLYEWMKRPDFWDRVNERRKEISGKNRLTKVHETWYLKAVGGEFQHMQLWLANFDPNFRMPTEKHEIEAGNGLADLVNRARNERLKQQALNGDSPQS